MSTLFKLIALFCLLTAAATAADPPTDPILRIETGMHTAPIKGIGVDAAERFLLTASDDKTLRLWNLATGELLTTYYVPLGKTPDEGKLYSGAISPDGEWVVGAGWTGDEWDNQYSIYLFQRANGKLVKRLSGLEDVIGHLCFSPDGQYLGATLGSLGIRIWHTQTWQLIFADRKYEKNSYWCDFDKQNRMVTTSYDGYLRLYALQGEGFASGTTVEAPGGKEPRAAVFSPNGDKIAVGFYDSTNVNVLDGKTLALLYAPDTTGIDNKGNNHLSSVAWSLDGNSLYAGGSYGNDLGTVVLQWPQAGQGTPYTIWQASLNVIADFRSLSNGRIVYGATDPAFAVLDSMGKKLIEKISTIVSYGGVYKDNFGISQEGSIISFWNARFSLLEQTLIVDRSPEAKITLNANLTSPDMTSLKITEWKDSYTPKFNGTLLPLKEHETSRSLAIAPDHSKFLLGTEWSLRLFDANGQQRWEVSIPSVAWGVNISGDGKKAVAALADGTIRWYNLENGQELLALFVQNDPNGTDNNTTSAHPSDKPWIAWMPSGYYMSSSDQADSLIGWQVNAKNGKDKEPNFYPAGALYASYKRPDVVKKILVTLNEQEAIQQANAEANNKVNTPTSVRAALDGVASRYDVNPDPTNKGRAIIIAAGGEQDSNKLYSYTNIATQEMYRFLHDQGFSDGDIVYMNPTVPTVPANGYKRGARQDFPVFDPPTELEQAFAQVTPSLKAGQQFILYVHGHARSDHIRMNPKAELSAQQLKDFLAKIPAGVQQIIILDTCYSGSFLDDLAGVPNRIVITSSDASSQAWTADKGSFSTYFMSYLQQASSVGEAFELARCDVLSSPDIFGAQQPQLDDTQDGIYTAKDCPNGKESQVAGKGSDVTGQEGQVASQVYLGGKKTHQASPPEIVEVHSPIHLTADQTTATFWVKTIPDFNGMKTVRAILLNEHDTATTYQGEETQATRRELTLTPNYQTLRYEATYDQFHTATLWKILYQAQSMEGVWSAISIGYVVAPNVDLPFQVEVNLNQAIYRQGDQMQFNLLTKGEGQVDLYAGIIFPMGFYQTVIDDSPLSLSLPNTFQPYQTYLRLRGQQTVSVFNVTALPALPPGQYQACGLLANHSDQLKAEDWLSFKCGEFKVVE